MTQLYSDKNESQEEPLFKQLKPPFKKGKEAIWAQLAEQLEEVPTPKHRIIPISVLRIAVAASFLLILTATLFARFYTTVQQTALGEQLAATLPDGSKVQMNSGSTLSYAPYWWYFDRQVQLEGEAFFEVKKGNKFTVASSLGQTSVLGTSFNINTQDDQYIVFCATGKVAVSTPKAQLILVPGEIAIRQSDGQLSKSSAAKEKVAAWVVEKFSFEELPLQLVLKAFERRYAVKIEFDATIGNMTYSAFYKQPEKIEDALDLICLSFNLKFVQLHSNKYQLSKQ